jgi:hypothetical protein
MEQDESEHSTLVAVEMREEEMGQGEEKTEMAVEAVVVTVAAQQTAASDEKDGVESAAVIMAKRVKESDEEGKREEEDVMGETWQMVQAKRQKLAAKKKKAKERKAKGMSVSASGEEKKAEVEVSQSVMSAREWAAVDGSGDDLILSDEEERRRLWTLSQLALSQADIDRAVVRPEEAHPALLTMLDVIHRLIDRWMVQCSSALTPNSNPFSDRQYASDWRCAVVRLCLSPTRFTNRCLSTALHSVPFPANFVLKTS